MKLSLITSSLIALGVAVPVLQGRTEPADLRSPVLVVKRVSEPAVEAPGLEARARPVNQFNSVARRPGGHRVTKREELEVVDESESALETPGLEVRARPVNQFNSAARRPGGHHVTKREELEVVDESESALQARGQGNRQNNDGNNRFFQGNNNFNHQQVKDSQGGRFQGGQFQGGQFQGGQFQGGQFQGGQFRGGQFQGGQLNPNNLNGGSQTANVQINGGQSIPVTMGQPKIVNGPVNSLATDKGNCMAASRNSNVNFSAGNPAGVNANGNGLGPIIAERELFLWCFDPTVLGN